MLDILENIERNKSKQSGFLSGDRKKGLERLFSGRGSGGKLKVEIGLNELKLSCVQKKKARNGQDMMVVKFYKSPIESSFKQTKDSYRSIDCYHMLQDECKCVFNDNFYKPFTTCLDEKSFTDIKKGDKYLCLVRHVEKLFKKQGEIMTYKKGDRCGKEIVLVEPQIVEIYPMNIDRDTIKFSYFELYKPLKSWK